MTCCHVYLPSLDESLLTSNQLQTLLFLSFCLQGDCHLLENVSAVISSTPNKYFCSFVACPPDKYIKIYILLELQTYSPMKSLKIECLKYEDFTPGSNVHGRIHYHTFMCQQKFKELQIVLGHTLFKREQIVSDFISFARMKIYFCHKIW